MENFCASKDIIKKVNSQPTERVQIFVNHTFRKGLIYCVKYKEH